MPTAFDVGQPAVAHPNSQLLTGRLNGNYDSCLVPGAMATDMGAMDWNYWNDLMQGAESSEMMMYTTQEIYSQDPTSSHHLVSEASKYGSALN